MTKIWTKNCDIYTVNLVFWLQTFHFSLNTFYPQLDIELAHEPMPMYQQPLCKSVWNGPYILWEERENYNFMSQKNIGVIQKCHVFNLLSLKEEIEERINVNVNSGRIQFEWLQIILSEVDVFWTPTKEKIVTINNWLNEIS